MSTGRLQTEVKILSIYIGCTLRLARLKKNLSQHDLGLIINTDSVAIGRIERAMHNTPWSKIYILANSLGINFNQMFELKTRNEVLSLIDECYSLDSKLTKNKTNYYQNLKEEVSSLFTLKEQELD